MVWGKGYAVEGIIELLELERRCVIRAQFGMRLDELVYFCDNRSAFSHWGDVDVLNQEQWRRWFLIIPLTRISSQNHPKRRPWIGLPTSWLPDSQGETDLKRNDVEKPKRQTDLQGTYIFIYLSSKLWAFIFFVVSKTWTLFSIKPIDFGDHWTCRGLCNTVLIWYV